MPADLEQQLPGFAEALDREAPAISVDEILSRGPVAVDADLVERPLSDRAWHRNRVSWTDASADRDGIDRFVPMELAPGAARRLAHRHVALKIALGVAAATVLVVAVATIVRINDGPSPVDVPTSTVPTELPATAPTTTLPTTEPPAATPLSSGGMWPQSTLEKVRAAQKLADAGDPAYTWQVDPQLTLYADETIEEIGHIELVDRFLREVLGWEAYIRDPVWSEGGDHQTGGVLPGERYLRCSPGRTNPLYPPQPDSDEPGESCAPTIDDLHYESVSLALAQLDRQGSDGIWVVNRWELTAPFAQADPAVVEAQATERMAEFLAARVAGTGAEGQVQVQPDIEVPLLYATTSGARYERYEIERVGGPHWPDGGIIFSARLFADGGATVVEQQISSDPSQSGGFWMDANATTENGQPFTMSYTSSDGEVTVSALSTWEAWLPGTLGVPVVEGDVVHNQALHVWSGSLWHTEESFGSEERIELVDPVAYDAWCAANGGSPLLTAPADAASIAQQVIADPNFVTTAPVAARIGGVDAVSLDVSLAPGGEACGMGMIEISRWIHTIAWEPGWRMRLYLIDLPEGMSVPTLAITVVAPEERLDQVIAETAPIIDSIEFHPQST